eukprot:CAMPEP_0198200640 /NCGR_PEP_ID=MMETSP1445-20131203/3626_1 /TAXON_ID=36898 /ORGANISM="Pyramimonas sp., Strain CCMP2087" /LENGTH=60 /DNA_ID=CAMNT_0043870769 /DNA_START=934 /DNA_END=1116 /DNA_ORIENTATION=+
MPPDGLLIVANLPPLHPPLCPGGGGINLHTRRVELKNVVRDLFQCTAWSLSCRQQERLAN